MRNKRPKNADELKATVKETYKRHNKFIHNLSKIKIGNKSNGSSLSVSDSLTVSLPGGVDGLYTLRSSHEGYRGKLRFLYHLTKYYSNSAEHTFLLITINGQAMAHKRDAIQYETKRNYYNEN